MPAGRVLALGTAAVLIGAAGIVTAVGRLDQAEARAHTYSIEVPGHAPAAGFAGDHLINVPTNLPEGTLVYFEEQTGSSSSGKGVTRVRNGGIEVQPNNNGCSARKGRLIGTRYRVTFTVAPEYDVSRFRCSFHSCPDLERQPGAILDVLGDRFQHVRGPQTSEGPHGRHLVVTGTIRLPAETCFGFQISPRLVPYPRGAFDRCPNLEGTVPVSRALRSDAMAAAGKTVGDGLFPRWSSSGKDDPLLVFGCGRAVAVRTWVVTLLQSGTPETTARRARVFLVRRAEGWHAWHRI